jgi:predicted DNA-binding transcriptional regulator YafY
MKRLDRLNSILILLQSRSLLRGRELAERFGVSLRTIYRDMLSLAESGVPIRSEAGMGYALERGYTFAPASLDLGEAGALVAAGKLLAAGALSFLGPRYASALEKIRAVLKEDKKAYVESLEGRILSPEGAGAGSRPEGSALFEAAQLALAEGRVARISYLTEGRSEPESRDIEPLALAFEGGSWRLVAYCRLRRGFRIFGAGRMLSCEVLAERFDPSAYEIPEHLLGPAFPSSRFARVLLSFALDAKVEALESSGYFGFMAERRAGDRLELEFLLDSPLFLAPYLLAYGASVLVLEPPELAAEMRRRSEELLRHYSGAC